RCRAVANGAPATPDDLLTAALADLRGQLSHEPAFGSLAGLWQREVARTVASMAREWRWRRKGYLPTIDEYLSNADNLAFCFIFASHLIALANEAAEADAHRLMTAARATQRTIRIINDLGTYRRDLATGDLNVLALAPSRRSVDRLLTSLVSASRSRFTHLRTSHPGLIEYLDRHIDFNLGFYSITDYWGRGHDPAVAEG